MELDLYDLKQAVRRLPKNLLDVMLEEKWHNNVFVGGGYLRSIVAGEPVNDVDVFVKSAKDAELLAYRVCSDKKDIVRTENAFTVKGKLPIQIIHRWVFDSVEEVGQSFDFTICCAVFAYDGGWISYCDDRFYKDIAAKRIVYRVPERNEDAGGSMIRVLKYYQKGYHIPLNSLGAIIARLIKNVDFDICKASNEERMAEIITGLLREVDPDIDPLKVPLERAIEV